MSTLEKDINFTREAFLHPLNMGLLFTSAMAAFFLSDVGQLSSIIFTLVLGMELIYLGVVPHLPLFQKNIRQHRMRKRNDALEERLIFQELPQSEQKRFLVLKHLSKLIAENFDKMPYSSQGLLENIRKKVQKLLSNYLTLLDMNKRYTSYSDQTLEENLKAEIENEEQVISQTLSERLRNTKKRRVAILKKRLREYKTATEKSMICETHLETIEDAIRYIYEQSMTMNDPKEIGFQLDNLLADVEETSEIIRDLDSDVSPIIEEEMYDIDTDSDYHSAEEKSNRNALKN